tara:strand:- start:12191 stop:12706 length:516 start_codon:yes stop_codon:yes gene_type:complete
MANGFLKNKRGQISIEFILIILIALIYIHSVIQPTVNIAAWSTEDVTRLGQAKLAAQKIASAVNQMAINPAAGKKTISVFVPKGGTVSCSGVRINFSAQMSNLRDPEQCPTCDQGCQGKLCKGYLEIVGGIIPTCNFGGNTTIVADDETGILRDLVVAKNSSGAINVDYAQ